MNISTVVFDLGGVLIDWNPRYLLKSHFASRPERLEYFLEHICNQEWNEQQDAGRSFAEGIADRLKKFPEFTEAIQIYDRRWPEMLGGAHEQTVEVLMELKKAGKHKLLALTNWSDETFHYAESRFPFLKEFQDILVSGREKLLKPDPRIYKLLLERHKLAPQESVFIDDVLKNVEGARSVGMNAIQFQSAPQLRQDLKKLRVLA